MKTSALKIWFGFLAFVALFAPLARAQVGNPGTALNLDGVNSCVQAPNGVWFSSDFTVEGWVFLRSYNTWSRLIDFADGSNTNNVFLALTAGTTGLPVFGVFTNNDGSPSIESSTQLPLGQWVHLAATLSGTTGTIYINGSPVATGTLNRPPNVVRTNNFIGRSNYRSLGDQDANAVFDEIRIWNVARSQSQIQAWMHRSLAGNESGLVGYWRFDEGGGATTADSSGTSTNATLVGDTTWTNSTVPMIAGAGSALNFNGVNAVGTIPHQPALNAYPLTVMAWFNSPATTLNGALINKYVAASDNGYQIFMSGGHLQGWYFRTSANNVYNGGPMDAGPVNDGIWHHAAMVIDATGGKLYLDGVLKSNLPWTGVAGPTVSTNPISLGIYQGNSFWAGQLDEISLWNTALSSNQVQTYMNQSLMGTEAGLLGYWRLDEGGGTNILDTTTNRFNGTLNSNTTWVSSGARLVVPDPGYGLSLNGTNAYVRVPSGVWFSNTFTIEGWAYARSYNDWSRLIDFGNGQYVQDVYLALSSGGSGLPTMGVFNTGGTPLVSSSSQLPLNQWAHLAATYDGTNGSIYINGNLTGSGAISGTTPNVILTNNYIGRSAFPSDAYANAIFDEIRIWNVVRTPIQLQENMNRPLTGLESGLVGYWRFDDDAGTNTVDATGNGNNATLVNGPAWVRSSTPANGAPILAPGLATNITSTNATLQAFVNPNGSPTTVWFSYGTNLAYGFTNVVPDVGSGLDPVLVTGNISGLQRGVIYHFQVSASNSFGLTVGVDQTFEAADPPTVTTGPATNVTSASATLNGTLNPNGADAVAWFQYGQSTNYDSVTPSTAVLATNLTAVSISNVISGLYAGIQYHFRLAGSNSSGSAFGADLTFTPPPLAPLISGQSVGNVTFTTAVLNASVTANGEDTTAWFEYGTTTNYGSSTASPPIAGTNLAAVPISNLISNLLPGTIYHFQLVATNVVGTSYGGDLSFVTPVFAQSNFTLPSIYYSSVAWGDYDNDGRLDIFTSGVDYNGDLYGYVWRNIGNGFTNINAGLPGVGFSSVAWGDYDNDGLLDILISGDSVYDPINGTHNPICQVWRNTGNGFTNINAGLPGVYDSSVAWGDYDNDGRLDILLSGLDMNNNPTTQVWRNTGNGFTNINAGLPGVGISSVAWGDYDNDGRLDILLSGQDTNNNLITEVWRNTGTGFTNINAGLPGVGFSSVAWGDYDNDGRLDILLSGQDTNNNPITEVWRNTGSGFTNINAGLPGVGFSSVAWGDYDNAGRLDILISGSSSAGPITQVWRNTGNGFTKIADLPGAYSGSVAWGDSTGDGRLDILLSGYGAPTQLFQNQTPAANSPPTAPSSLSLSLSGSALTLSWNPSSDLQTPPAGLSYNLRIGTSPGGSDILDPMAAADGTRRVAQRGSIQQQQLTLFLNPLPLPGTILYGSVQSVDTSFAGSPFAPEASILVHPSFTSSGLRSDGVFQALFDVQAGTNYTIQASTDLVHWLDLLDFSFDSSSAVLFTDPGATNYSRRFYRFGQH